MQEQDVMCIIQLEPIIYNSEEKKEGENKQTKRKREKIQKYRVVQCQVQQRATHLLF